MKTAIIDDSSVDRIVLPQPRYKTEYFIPDFIPFAGKNMQIYADLCR